jgi:signal peptidase I
LTAKDFDSALWLSVSVKRPMITATLEDTILLKDVTRTDSGLRVTDHIWFTVGKTISVLELQPGDIVEFDARVGDYVKGYVNNREYIDERILDYKLNRPTRFEPIAVGATA